MTSSRLQQTLQAVAQSVQWTYSLFWQLCSQQWVLVWNEGYYNGPIKTRKTVQPMEVSTEEASLQRSQQLRELYDSLAAGETNQPARRPCASLSPEDLTESEWFYLMCISFSFPRGVGLPGEAFAKRRHVWLTHANEVDTKVFSRAILAKSANIQTVVCIPVMDGVLELGTTEKVEEDIGLIQHVKSFFLDHQNLQTMSETSEHSTSNVVSSTNQTSLRPQLIMQQMNRAVHNSNYEDDDEEEEDDEGDDDDDDNVDEDEVIDHDGGDGGNRFDDVEGTNQEIISTAEASELMQFVMSEDIRIGSAADECSNILESELQLLAVSHNSSDHPLTNQRRDDDDTLQTWHLFQEDLCHEIQQSSGSQMEDLSLEDAHYFETVSSILQHNSSVWITKNSSSLHRIPHKSQSSAFSKWGEFMIMSSEGGHHRPLVLSQLETTTSQWLLKKALLNTSSFYSSNNNYKCSMDDDKYSSKEKDGDNNNTNNVGGAKFRKGGATAQEEVSVNHVLAERRRREKLNERFIILRSLVPFVTKEAHNMPNPSSLIFLPENQPGAFRIVSNQIEYLLVMHRMATIEMDKASILGDTIEYLKQLRRRIQDLEFKNKQLESHGKLTTSLELDQSSSLKDEESLRRSSSTPTHTLNQNVCISKDWNIPNKKKMRVIGGESINRPDRTFEASSINVQVSIKDDDAIMELHCPHGDGLLLKIMQTLHGLQVEVTSIQSSSIDGLLDAKLRAKVREVDGRRANIMEVKKAIYSIFSNK